MSVCFVVVCVQGTWSGDRVAAAGHFPDECENGQHFRCVRLALRVFLGVVSTPPPTRNGSVRGL